jgi:hypothetical protein
MGNDTTSIDSRVSSDSSAPEQNDVPWLSMLMSESFSLNNATSRASIDLESQLYRPKEKHRSSPTGPICAACEKLFNSGFYCNICELIYCNVCWDLQPTHRKGRDTRLLHEKTDEKLARAINRILYPELTPEQCTNQHVEDHETEWFGVEYPEDIGMAGPQVSFVTTRRMQEILDPVCKQSQLHKYPSIVSFVGETGAGKSTLIKALIEVSVF